MASDLRRREEIAPAPRPRRRRPRVTESRVVFAAALAVYIAVAWWLSSRHLVPQDAISRSANGYYTMFSRDPHLAAVGAVWNPLPSLVLLPLLPLASLVPTLTMDGLVAGVCSALFAATSVAICHDITRRLGLGRASRLTLTALLGLHPMVLLYAGNGMSEALFLCTLLLATRSLLRWFAEDRPERLVSLGAALALAYASRYEALAPALAAPVAVLVVSWWRTRSGGLALTDAMLAILPPMLAVGLWAACCKIVDHQWFPTFSSEYGNAAQVAASRADIDSMTGSALGDRLGYALQQMLGLQPLVPLVLLVVAVVAVRRRDARSLAPLAVLGSVLLFDNLAFLMGSSFGWLRFQITVVPLLVLLVAILLTSPPARSAPPPRRAPRVLALTAGLLAAAAAVPVTVHTLTDPRLAREESAFLNADGARRTRYLAGLNLHIGAAIDALDLPDGAVLTDSAYSYAIILASRKPRQFVINSDRDFAEILADPKRHHVRYLLVSGNGPADAVRAAYPRLDATADGTQSWPDDQGRTLFTLIPVR
ncbi:glycosyltransferase family 39 protein [Dactylosporangium sp. CA-139114]|uniref:glycosyltransferase family 39 protein n=1 Tax=Dactylosporangium sp. CA-139114 TaxID=3239931 RepID=UPI003D988F7A